MSSSMSSLGKSITFFFSFNVFFFTPADLGFGAGGGADDFGGGGGGISSDLLPKGAFAFLASLACFSSVSSLFLVSSCHLLVFAVELSA